MFNFKKIRTMSERITKVKGLRKKNLIHADNTVVATRGAGAGGGSRRE